MTIMTTHAAHAHSAPRGKNPCFTQNEHNTENNSKVNVVKESVTLLPMYSHNTKHRQRQKHAEFPNKLTTDTYVPSADLLDLPDVCV